jgi:hypothetical protein
VELAARQCPWWTFEDLMRTDDYAKALAWVLGEG